jgi:hypothetical protein
MNQLPTSLTDTAGGVVVEQRRFVNRYPRASGAVWFGTAAAVSSIGIYFVLGGTSPPMFRLLGVLATGSALVFGTVLGASVGRPGRGWRFAAIMGALVVLCSYITMGLGFALFDHIALGELLQGLYYFYLFAFVYTGWVTLPLGIAVAIHLNAARKKPAPTPKVLGCGQQHTGAILEKPDEPPTDTVN